MSRICRIELNVISLDTDNIRKSGGSFRKVGGRLEMCKGIWMSVMALRKVGWGHLEKCEGIWKNWKIFGNVGEYLETCK